MNEKISCMSKVVLLLLCVIYTCISVVDGSNNNIHVVPVHLVSEVNTRYRTRRDVPDESMPDRLTFQMNFLDKPLILRLRQSELLDVTTSDPTTTLQGNTFLRDSAVYTDLSLSSILIVHRNNGKYNLTGKFTAFGDGWDIKPTQVETNTTMSLLHTIVSSLVSYEIHNFKEDTENKEKDEPEIMHTSEYNISEQHPGNRRRRAVTQHVIEIAFVVEYLEYLSWISLYGEINGLSNLRLWYTFVAEGINANYQAIDDPDISIAIRVTILKVLTNSSEKFFLTDVTKVNQNKVEETIAAQNLSYWVEIQLRTNKIPLSDHYMLFTRKGHLGVYGFANIGAACYTRGVSMIQNVWDGFTVTIATHELGHSISSLHDSKTGGKCNDTDKYVMATTGLRFVDTAHQGNPWRFSQCSIDSFKSYLAKVSCTRPENTLDRNVLSTPVAGHRAGETFSKDQQCQMYANNTKSAYYKEMQRESNGDKAADCRLLCCQLSSNGKEICSGIHPLEYTPCGDSKACVRGFCVSIKTNYTTTQSDRANITLVTTQRRPTNANKNLTTSKKHSSNPKDHSTTPKTRSAFSKKLLTTPKKYSSSPKDNSTTPKTHSSNPKDHSKTPRTHTSTQKKRPTTSKNTTSNPKNTYESSKEISKSPRITSKNNIFNNSKSRPTNQKKKHLDKPNTSQTNLKTPLTTHNTSIKISTTRSKSSKTLPITQEAPLIALKNMSNYTKSYNETSTILNP